MDKQERLRDEIYERLTRQLRALSSKLDGEGQLELDGHLWKISEQWAETAELGGVGICWERPARQKEPKPQIASMYSTLGRKPETFMPGLEPRCSGGWHRFSAPAEGGSVNFQDVACECGQEVYGQEFMEV